MNLRHKLAAILLLFCLPGFIAPKISSAQIPVFPSGSTGAPTTCTAGTYGCLATTNIWTALNTFSFSATLPELAIVNPMTGSYGPACLFFQAATGTFNDHAWQVGVGCDGASDQAAFTLCGLNAGSSGTACNFSLPNNNTVGGWVRNPMAIGNNAVCSGSTILCVNGQTQSASYATNTNCSSAASPAVCSSAAAGSVLIPTGTTSETLVVNTTAVTANSQIMFYPDDTLGTKLGVTCNSTLATLVGGSFISARTAGTSFTITFNGTILTNGVCGSYSIIN